MKTLNFIKKTLIFFLPLLIAATANSQNAPIGCNGQFFVTHGSGNTATSTTSVKKLSFSGLIITPNVFNVDPGSIGFNAIGINPLDGYMYGLRYPTSGNRPRLVRVGSGTPGNIVDLGEISDGGGNLSDGDIGYAGCFDAAGVFYFITDNNEMFKITGNNYPATSTAVTYIGNPSGGGSGTNFFVDIAVNPVGGVMYGVTFNSRLYTINMTTGVSTFIGTHIGTDYIASLFFDETGNLFGYRQDGSFFLIDKTNATLTNAGTGTAYTYADGCSCSFGRVFHDLTSQKGICPTVANPNPEWDITVATTNQTSSQQTGLTYTLEIPSNRFSIIETPAVIANRLFTAGLIPANNPSLVTISTVAPAAGSVKNKIVVSSFQTGGVNSTISFTLKLKLVTLYGAYAPVPLQSSITGLPAIIGSSDLSNDPTTATPDDPTLVNFCPLITLPAKLISFTGVYKNNTSLLYWVAENQVNLSHYEVERSENGTDFSRLTIKAPQQSSTSREQYQYTDDIAGSTAATLYYRLKIVDTDGQYKYSNIILIRRETKAIDGISISPNPVINADNVTVRITANATKNVDLKVMDMAGRVMLQQQTRVTEGNNSITLNNLNRLQAGIYLLQMMDGSDLNTIKFVITR